MKYKAFVINLDRNPERLVFMTKQLSALNIPFERLNAIDGNIYDFTNDYNEELYKKYNKGTIATPGVKGCALSHRKCLEKMIEDGLDYAIIFEDDIEIKNEFKDAFIREIEKRENGKTKWEYLSFNYPTTGLKSIYLWIFLFSEQFKKNKKSNKFLLKLPIYLIKFFVVSVFYIFEGIREYIYKKLFKNGCVVKFYRPLFLAGCYITNREGAKKLIKLNTPIQHTADGLPNAARKISGLKFYAYTPLLARQKRETFESTLNNDHFGKKVITY